MALLIVIMALFLVVLIISMISLFLIIIMVLAHPQYFARDIDEGVSVMETDQLG